MYAMSKAAAKVMIGNFRWMDQGLVPNTKVYRYCKLKTYDLCTYDNTGSRHTHISRRYGYAQKQLAIGVLAQIKSLEIARMNFSHNDKMIHEYGRVNVQMAKQEQEQRCYYFRMKVIMLYFFCSDASETKNI